MQRRLLAWTTLLVAGACGGRTSEVLGAAADATAADDADSASADAREERSSIPDASSDASGIDLQPCVSQADCDWGQTCQHGYCCAGIFDGTSCRCHDGPGCKLPLICCDPNWYQDGGCQPKCWPRGIQR